MVQVWSLSRWMVAPVAFICDKPKSNQLSAIDLLTSFVVELNTQPSYAAAILV